MPTDILRLSENLLGGADYIIGDVHGAASALEVVLNTLQDNDRLFIVGDLFDRGEDSLRVFRLIQAKNANRETPQVYVVMGNHEELFLSAHQYWKLVYPDFNWDGTEEHPLIMQLLNRGDWVYQDQALSKKIALLLHQFVLLRATSCTRFHWFEFLRTYPDVFNDTFIQKINNSLSQDIMKDIAQQLGTWVMLQLKTMQRIDGLDDIAAFITELPYVITVGALGDSNAFIVCHSDMPFSDVELLETDIFSETEKHYMLWARPKALAHYDTDVIMVPCEGHVRHVNSTRVYCGHNVISDNNRFIYGLREKTNTFNLDVVAHYYHFFWVMKHDLRDGVSFSMVSHKPLELLPLHLTQLMDYVKKRLQLDVTVDAALFDSNPEDWSLSQSSIKTVDVPQRKTLAITVLTWCTSHWHLLAPIIATLFVWLLYQIRQNVIAPDKSDDVCDGSELSMR